MISVADNSNMGRLTVIRGIWRALGWLPLPINHAVGAALGALLWVVPNRQRRRAAENIALCWPELSRSQRAQLLRQTLRELGKSATELGVLWHGSKSRIRRMIKGIEGQAVWERCHEGTRPTLVIAPHLGAFEALNVYASQTLRLRGLYRPPRQAALEPLLLEGRGRFGSEMIRADRKGLIKLLRGMTPEDVVAILPDQVPKRGQGVEAPFFGHPAQTMVLFGRLAQRLDPHIITGFAERLSWGRGYQLHFADAHPDVGDSSPPVAASALNREVERCVRQVPNQYQWNYARFAGVSAAKPDDQR